MELIIKHAKSADLPHILQLQKACYRSEAAIYNDYAIPPLQQDFQALENEFSGCIFLKAVAANEIVGSVRAFFNGDTCFIGKLIVKEEVQNQGIGKLLLRKIEESFPASKRFELFTGHKSNKNLYLYRKLGYKEFRKEIINNNITMIYLEKSK